MTLGGSRGILPSKISENLHAATTVSKLVVWKARYKGSVNGFKIAPPSSGRGSADFLVESLMIQGVLNARR